MAAKEIKGLYKVFPITVGFRKYTPVNEEHLLLLDDFGTNMGGFYIVGDFIAGNWRNNRCIALSDNNTCSLHTAGLKPLQCSLVPFCALYPESIQHLIIEQQKRETYSDCLGFKGNDETVWQGGIFVNQALKDAFVGYQRALREQKEFMQRLLRAMRGSDGYRAFLAGRGILETAIPVFLYNDLFMLIGIQEEETSSLIESQIRVMEDRTREDKNESVFNDALRELRKIKSLRSNDV